MAKPCEVCAASESKYKCPTCRLPYCSAACYKKHKETPCASVSAAASTSGSSDAAPLVPATGAALTASNNQLAAAAPVTGEETETEGEDDGPRLTIDQLGLLKTSDFVRKHLANPAIVQALTQVSEARSFTPRPALIPSIS